MWIGAMIGVTFDMPVKGGGLADIRKVPYLSKLIIVQQLDLIILY